MINFDDLFIRADEEIIQNIIGRNTINLLGKLYSGRVMPSDLQKLILEIHSPEELLSDAKIRNEILNMLYEDEAKQLLSHLGSSILDSPHSKISSYRFRNNSEEKKRLFEFFGVTISVTNDRHLVPDSKKIISRYRLFNHQREIIQKIRINFQENKERLILHMPTGSGKTRTAMSFIADFLRLNEPALIVWLAFSEELCEQAAQEFQKAWKFLGNRELGIHRYWGTHRLDIDNIKDGVLIAGLSKLYSKAKRDGDFLGKIGRNVKLLVMDEAHQSIADTYSLVIQLILAYNHQALLLGLTATPGRSYTDDFENDRLVKFFHTNIVSLEIEGYDNPVDYLVEKKYLAKIKYTPIEYDDSLTPYLKGSIENGNDFSSELMEALAADESRNFLIFKTFKELVQRHQRIIVFAISVGHSDILAKTLRFMGNNAYSLTSKTSQEKRKAIIEKFKSKSVEPIILCNYGILTTGFDAPKTSCAVITRPTKSLVLYSQMIGRAIRGLESGGNEEAEIVTVIDRSLPGFKSVAEAFFYWNKNYKRENVYEL